jgi:Ca-activated chloride channel family protein
VFEYPWVLLALLVLPLAVWLRRQGLGRPAAVRYPETGSVRSAFHGGRRPGSGWCEILRLAAIALLILAAARPRWIQAEQQLTTTGLDILLAVDISGSMSARDFEPQNRLQAAKAVLREFIISEHANRLGLVAFAARAYTICPLTLDYQSLLGLLEHLDIGMTADGTAIGMAIATSLNRLKASDAQAKVIILLTDGRNNAGALTPLTAAQMAAALGVRIYAIGMGKPGGAPIFIQDPVRGETALLNDDGSVHVETVDEESLKQLAAATGGRYFRATDRDKLKAIYSEISSLERTRLSSKIFRNRKDVGQHLLALALLCFLMETGLAQTLEKRIP